MFNTQCSMFNGYSPFYFAVNNAVFDNTLHQDFTGLKADHMTFLGFLQVEVVLSKFIPRQRHHRLQVVQ